LEEEINSQYEIIDSHENRSLFDRLELTWLTILKHFALFVLTFISVAFTYIYIGFAISLSLAVIFAVMLLAFLGTHEFGHYFASVHHKIRTTLPYFIPLPIFSPIGTMGAVIRIKEPVDDSKKLFDIGISGPLAGFIVSLGLLIYGFATLPGIEFVYAFPGHAALKEYVTQFHSFPKNPIADQGSQILMLGNTLLYSFLGSFFKHVPPMWEMYHYPFLFAGWLGLFFTALNLTPVGQLDGGHVIYALLGHEKHKQVARGFFGILSVLSGLGVVPVLRDELIGYNPSLGPLSWVIWGILLFFMLRKAFNNEHNWIAPIWGGALISSALLLYLIIGMNNASGYTVWLVWSLFILFFVKIEHPPVIIERPLDKTRIVLGWLSMLIFILCISPNPMYILNS